MGTDQEQDVLELSTGVKLRLRNASPLLIDAANKTIRANEPKPPRVFIQEKEREEENPNDPVYIAAYRVWQAEMGLRGLRALIPLGTALVSKPDEVVGPDDDDFADLMEAMEQEPGKGKYSRYVQWVMSVACGTAADIALLSMGLLRHAGVREEDVSEMLKEFPSDEERGTNTGVSPERRGEHGDSIPEPIAGPGVAS